VDADKINQMKKNLADDLGSDYSGPPKEVKTDTTHKTKTVVKKLAQINLNHFLIFATFSKILKRHELLISDEILKMVLLKLDSYNVQIGCVDFMKFLKQSYRFRDEIDMKTGRFKPQAQKKIDYSPEQTKLRAMTLIKSAVKRYLER
jgi:hypothetical protein